MPLFVGVANVTELFDADSVGLNALLARLSAEVNASIMLATEKSTKAKGTVKEEVAAAKMMYLAKKRASVPKDLGIDLLVLKDKRSREEPYNPRFRAANRWSQLQKVKACQRNWTAQECSKSASTAKTTSSQLHCHATPQWKNQSKSSKEKQQKHIYTKIVQIELSHTLRPCRLLRKRNCKS